MIMIMMEEETGEGLTINKSLVYLLRDEPMPRIGLGVSSFVKENSLKFIFDH